MKRFLALLALSLAFASSAARAASSWELRIYDARTGALVTEADWLKAVSAVDEIVLGEKHDTAQVQDTEAWVIDQVMSVRKGESFTTAWEFLDWSAKASLDKLYGDFVAKRVDAHDFLVSVFGAAGAPTYEPVMEATRSHGGLLLPTNLSRTEKAPVVKGGVKALDPKLLPPGFTLGSSAYFDRFYQAMGGHGDPKTLENYFAAQCLVDEAVAYHVTDDVTTDLRFLVIGNFHTAFFDGTYASLERRAPKRSRVLIHIENGEEYTEADMKASLSDATYGAIADYVIFAGKPAVPAPAVP